MHSEKKRKKRGKSKDVYSPRGEFDFAVQRNEKTDDILASVQKREMCAKKTADP